ncbi:hypothetical protein PG2009B_1723 [Bifidobacterium pseudolongum subsp. globosum]|nr:hypothetical protein PG2009B_1723 [Bifidobacterium pseudolongum subsp. globosum]
MRASSGLSFLAFQSTPPRREMTRTTLMRRLGSPISIHTSPKGDDTPWKTDYEAMALFQSTPPRREMTYRFMPKITHLSFQSTPPRREMTEPVLNSLPCGFISIHTSPKGDDANDSVC